MSLEASKRPGKFKPKQPGKKTRVKDDFDWRADPSQTTEAQPLIGGFKSIKHRWLAMYQEELKEQCRRLQEDNRLSPSDQSNGPTDAHGSGAGPAEHNQGCNDASGLGEREGDFHGAAKRDGFEKGAMDGIRETFGEKEEVEKAAQKERQQAEAELAQAAEHNRGAQVASSLEKETHRHTGPDPLQEPVNTQATHRPAEALKERTSEVHVGKPALSVSGRYNPSGNGTLDPLDDIPKRVTKPRTADRRRERRAQNDGQKAPGRSTATSDQARRPESIADVKMEADDTERNGAAAENLVPRTSSRGAAMNAHALGNGSLVADPQALTQVSFIDGNEKEQLGELDLHQLASFRDLWLTIRSAYSASLPKGDLKLIYRDADNDLMQYQSEPWEHFRGMARSLFLARNTAEH